VPTLKLPALAAIVVLAACTSPPGASADAAEDARPPADASVPDGAMSDAATDATPCRADCDCSVAVCIAGLCDPNAGRPAIGICGVPGADCPCAGGTCVERCCILPDGGVDNGSGPACMPMSPDAGP